MATMLELPQRKGFMEQERHLQQLSWKVGGLLSRRVAFLTFPQRSVDAACRQQGLTECTLAQPCLGSTFQYRKVGISPERVLVRSWARDQEVRWRRGFGSSEPSNMRSVYSSPPLDHETLAPIPFTHRRE